MMELKHAILDSQISDLNTQMRQVAPEAQQDLMRQIFELYQLKAQFSKILGERIVNPR
ncbi:MAG: hypothetical protein K2N16_00435 [Muribaculaceae bacterium]|nr:hypothetical protein [Muribaculaceae bacterium]